MSATTRFLSRFARGALVLTGAAAMFLSLGGDARPAAALSNCSVPDNAYDAEEQEFLRLINQYRTQNGLGALTVSTNLNRAANWMAADLADKNYFSHTDSLGRTPTTRVPDCGGQPQAGENLAAGTVKDSAKEAFEMWRNSPGHNTNMLYAAYKQIGIARHYDASSKYTWYWVTEFSTTDDGTRAGTSSSAPAPPPAPEPPASTSPIAVMTSPGTGATLQPTQTLTWAPGSESTAYFVYVGSSRGGNNMLSVYMGDGTSLTLQGLPKTGSTVYVRLWSLTSIGWQYNDYTYRLPR